MNTATWKSRLSAGGLRPVLCAVGAALFLLVAYILYFHRTDLWHLWLPASANNDEVIYNRQLAGVLSGGQPEGVYGYNEGRAVVGHFGGWGPVLFFLYAIPGLVTGSGVNAMFWCNLLFAVAGWVLFACGTRLSARRQLLVAVTLFVCWYPCRRCSAAHRNRCSSFCCWPVWGLPLHCKGSSRWAGSLCWRRPAP